MKNKLVLTSVMVTVLMAFAPSAQAQEPMEQVVERGLQRAHSQSLILAEALKDKEGALPRTFENGQLQIIRFDHWVSGFFPGVLWMLYENSGCQDRQLRQWAELYTARVEPAKRVTNTHDLGFMLYCSDFLPTQEQRHSRLAAQLERMISPEGSYPVTGRSIVYRFGSFHALADAALLHILPHDVRPAQVRCALTAVIQRQLSQPRTFDADGWLRIGYTGSQIRMSEDYINTGSLYLCTAAFLPLGLPATDAFWAAPYCDWTARKAWNGQNVGADHAIR